jgi:hypothetical protein
MCAWEFRIRREIFSAFSQYTSTLVAETIGIVTHKIDRLLKSAGDYETALCLKFVK